jgi:hypothetical protein
VSADKSTAVAARGVASMLFSDFVRICTFSEFFNVYSEGVQALRWRKRWLLFRARQSDAEEVGSECDSETKDLMCGVEK